MAHIGLSAQLVGDLGIKLRRIIAYAQKPFGGTVGRDAIKAARKVIMSEFSRGGHYRPAGGFDKWPSGHDFGTHQAPPVPLGGLNGRLARAWNGGPGGFDRVSADGQSAVIGVSIPWARVHRGPDSNPVAGRFTTIRPKRGLKMRHFLGMNFGVWMSAERLKRGLKVPTRPHATDNPTTRAAVSALISKAMANA
mgnify:FL=1